MFDFFNELSQSQQDLIVKILIGVCSVLGTASTFLFTWLISRWRHKKRVFRNRIHFSDNLIEQKKGALGIPDSWLKLRCAIEDKLDDVLDNPVLKRLLMKAADKCTEEFPLVLLDDKDDQWLLMTTILNYISALDPTSHNARRANPDSVELTRYLFSVTYEPYGDIRVRKFRVMIIKEECLKKFLDEGFRESLRLEAPSHKDRIRTLHTMAQIYWPQPGQTSHTKDHVIRWVELPSLKVG